MDTIHVLVWVWLAGSLAHWSAVAAEERRQVVRIHPFALWISSLYWPFQVTGQIWAIITGNW